LRKLELKACPSAGACGGQFTANTMACVSEAIGLALPYSAGTPAPYEQRDKYALASGKSVMNLLSKNIINNVEFIIGGYKTTNLPLSKIDLLLMVDVYHELEFPHEIMRDIYDKLKPSGNLVLVEYRGEDEELMIKPLHKMSKKQIALEMKSVGFFLERNLDILPRQHMLFFKKHYSPAQGVH